jgi:hypothetical protein
MKVNVAQEQRNTRRILAVCRVLDLHRKFLGFTLDLNHKGIQLIVNHEFPQQSEFEIILSQGRENQNHNPDVFLTVEQAWRFSASEGFDQIGGKIINADSLENLDNLICYCEHVEKEKYHPD